MKAVIYIDVPEYQIGQPVSVHFKDTMCVKGVCEEQKFSFNLDPECSKCAGFEPEARQTRFYADMNKVHSTEITCRMIEQCRWLKKNAEGLREH